MEKEEKQKLLDAIHEVRQKEHERLHENLDHASEVNAYFSLLLVATEFQ